MEIIKKVGIDPANGNFKMSYGGKIIHYYNTLTEITDSNMNKMLNLGNRDEYEYDGKKYYIGIPGATGSGSKNADRYISDEYRLSVIFALSQLVNSAMEENFKIVTGVPAAEIENNAILNDIQNNLIGKYNVKVNDIDRRFKISEVKVISQPVATLLYLYSVGKIKNLNADYLIFDIGFGTSDISVVNLKQSVKKNDSRYIAMSNVYQDILDKLNMIYPQFNVKKAVKTIYELDEKIRNDGYNLNFPKGTINAKDVINNVYAKYSSQLYKEFFAFDSDFETYEKIIVTGGGGLVLFDELKKVMKDNRLELCDKPLFSNVLGMEYLAGKKF